MKSKAQKTFVFGYRRFLGANCLGATLAHLRARKLWRRVCVSSAALCCALLWAPASAQEINQEGKREAKTSAPPMMTVHNPTGSGGAPYWPDAKHYISFVDTAPALAVFLNDNQPIFGLPGTYTGPDKSQWTHASGDWGGARTELAKAGVFFNIYTTGSYQYVNKGLVTGSSGMNAIVGSVALDTGRLGMWPGGLMQFTAMANPGSKPLYVNAAGTSTFAYTGAASPSPFERKFGVQEFYLLQGVNPHLSLLFGKVGTFTLADQTLFGTSYKNDWANFAFSGVNPIFASFYGVSSIVGLAIIPLNDEMQIWAGVTDPFSKSTNFAQHFLQNGQFNIFTEFLYNYQVGGLPGQFVTVGNFSNKELLNLAHPIQNLGLIEATLRTAQSNFSSSQSSVAQESAIPAAALTPQPNYKHSSFVVTFNASQYLVVKDDPETIAKKLKAGQTVRGIGLQARLGWGPSDTNYLDKHGSLGIYAYGLFDARPRDRFGVGAFYDGVSYHLRRDFRILTGRTLRNEGGMEVFYTANIIPAVDLSFSYQHIWNPMVAQAVKSRVGDDVFLTRLGVNW